MVKRDIRLMLLAAREKRIPLLIGSARGAGGGPHPHGGDEIIPGGARGVRAGRPSPPPIFAAIPLLHGFDPGLVWHMAKTIECGVSPIGRPRLAPDSVMARVRRRPFIIQPLDPGLRCPA